MCVSSCLAGWLSMYLSMCVSKYPGTQFLLFSLFSFQKTLIELIEGMLSCQGAAATEGAWTLGCLLCGQWGESPVLVLWPITQSGGRQCLGQLGLLCPSGRGCLCHSFLSDVCNRAIFDVKRVTGASRQGLQAWLFIFEVFYLNKFFSCMCLNFPEKKILTNTIHLGQFILF